MTLQAGRAVFDINPDGPVQLFGYPHVRRISTGVHDPLLASVLWLDNGDRRLLMIALDLLFLDPPTSRSIRKQVSSALEIPEPAIFISCTHTHSGPVTTRPIAWWNDPVATPPDPAYLKRVGDRVTCAAREAAASSTPAEIAWTSADATGVGGNRLQAGGLTDPECGILAVRDARSHELLSVSLVYGMHPTVLHEDSTLVSADFPHFTRESLKERWGSGLGVLFHTAPCGNQSPRYYVTGQTFAEAERLGRKLGEAVIPALERLQSASWLSSPSLEGVLKSVDLQRQPLLALEDARKRLAEYRAKYDRLKGEGAPQPQVRTAECAIFGAEGAVAMAEAEATGEIEGVMDRYPPIEVQRLRIGGVNLIGLPGECFTEYSLAIKRGASRKTFVACLVNGELQGYIVTPETFATGGYEASGALFDTSAGDVLVRTALDLC